MFTITKEVFLIAALLCFVLFLVLFSVRNRVQGVNDLMLASVLGMVGNVLYAFGRELPPLIAYEAANAVYACASAAAFVGFRRLYKKAPFVLVVASAIVALTILIGLFHYVFDSFPGRTAVASLFQVAVAAGIGYTVLQAFLLPENSKNPNPKLFVLGMCGLIAGGHLFRVLTYLLADDAPRSLLEPNGWNVLFLSFGAFALPVLLLGGLLLAHRRIVSMAEHAANRDFLTGAWSRRAFFEAGERELARARRTGRPMSLLLADMDNFKGINDMHGHAAGDAVLISFVRRGQAELRTLDCFARIGGDEFAILLPETDLSGAIKVAERLRARVSSGAQDSSSVEIRFSAGVAELYGEDSLNSLMKRADDALYQAKAVGRNRTSIASKDVPADSLS